MTIRTAVPDDAPAIVPMANAIDVTSFANVTTFRALLERPAPPDTERLVAELDGRIVAWCPSGRYGTGGGWAWIGVDPAARRLGVGGALHERVEKRLLELGAPTIVTQITDEDGRRFVEGHGYRPTNTQSLQSLDLEGFSADPLPGAVPLRDAPDLFELYAAARADIPSAAGRRRLTRDDYLTDVLGDKQLDDELSVVLVEDGEPVAFAFVLADREGGRAGAQMTGVRRDRRRRGIATAVKRESCRRAAAAGVKTMLASNDRENAPMLAINRKLGFAPSILLEDYEKALC